MNKSSSGLGMSSGGSGSFSSSSPSTTITTTTTTTTTSSNSQPQSTVASVHFKARCELLGHGEDVYMVPLEDTEHDNSNNNNNSNSNRPLPPPSPLHRHKMIRLYTTAQAYPWYSTLSSLAMPVLLDGNHPNHNYNSVPPLPLVDTTAGTTTGTSTAAAAALPSSGNRHLFANAYRKEAEDQSQARVPGAGSTPAHHFRYRYAVFRAGVFHRWETAADENYVSTSNTDDPRTSLNTSANTHHDHTAINITIDEGTNVAMELDHTTTSTTTTTTTTSSSSNSETALDYHVLPLRFLHAGETYVVNDVLGKRKGQKPDIYHKKLSLHTGDMHYVGVDGSGAEAKTSTTNLNSNSNNKMSSSSATAGASATSMASAIDTDIGASATTVPTPTSGNKKSVGFAPEPAPTHKRQPFSRVHHGTNNTNNNTNTNNTNGTTTHHRRSAGEAVQLNATDGLVVVSAFLPVVVHRDETSRVPKWTADWDYEALLSMQTHLRVTRVGVVKWKGWHGNYNQNTGNATTTTSTSSSNTNSNTTSTSTSNAEEPPPAEHLGVPIEERYLVEECLRPFHCVPVWIDPLIFGEM